MIAKANWNKVYCARRGTAFGGSCPCRRLCFNPDSGKHRRYIDDSTITAKLKSDLVEDNRVSATDVHVKTYKGVVDLSGFVNSQSDISEAGSMRARFPASNRFTTT